MRARASAGVAGGLSRIAATLTVGFLVAGCGNGGSELPPLPPGWSVFYPAGATICANGSEYAYFVSPGTTNKLLVELEGGGACWNDLTCALPYPENPDGVYLDEVDVQTTLATLNGGTGIYDRNNPSNPFRDWYHVFIPYCTGDVHYGDNTKVYTEAGRQFTIHHKGRVNAQAVIDWVFASFRDPDQTVVTGCSAGSLGSIAWVSYVMDRYPGAFNRHFGDSFVGVLTEELFEDAFPNWNAFGVFAPFIPGLSPEDLATYRPDLGAYIYVQTAKYFRKSRFSQYNSNYDSTQTAFYTAGGGQGGAQAWSEQMRSLIAEIHSQVSNFDSYIGAGTNHCYIPYDRFYQLDTNGVFLDEWVSGFVAGSPVATEVDCAPDCGAPAARSEETMTDFARHGGRP